MWQHSALQKEPSRFTLPALANNGLLTSIPHLQRSNVLKLNDEIVCNLGDDVSQIPAATRGIMKHLGCRHSEVSQWQAQISDSIGQVDREITAVELVKDSAERFLQERQLYSQLMSNCVALQKTLSATGLTKDPILMQLKREEQLNNETRDLLQKQIGSLLQQLSALKGIRTQLLADFQDKGEAIKLTTKCIAFEVDTPSYQLPTTQYKPNYVTYDKWLSRCRELRLTAANLIKDSTAFRGNLRFNMANLKNVHEHQRRSTHDSLRKKINELSKIQDTMNWESQQVKEEISELTKDVEKVTGQIRNCESKLFQATHRLDILNQRPGHELCLDQPHISLTLEKDDLTKMAAKLNPVLRHSQQELVLAQRRLMTLEDKLDRNGQTLKVEQKCQNLHQSFLPTLDTTVILANKLQIPTSMRSSAPHIHL